MQPEEVVHGIGKSFCILIWFVAKRVGDFASEKGCRQECELSFDVSVPECECFGCFFFFTELFHSDRGVYGDLVASRHRRISLAPLQPRPLSEDRSLSIP